MQAVVALTLSLFREQMAVARSVARLIAVLTSRRAGKTQFAVTKLLITALLNPYSQCLYVALTRPSAKRIAWDLFQKLNRKYKLGLQFKESELVIVAPNKSKIWLLGADQPNWIERVYGQAFYAVVVDEAGSYEVNMHKFVHQVLRPTTIDTLGSIYLIGTPQDNTRTFFYDLTRPEVEERVPGWEVHTWNTLDNPHMRAQWEQEIEELKAANPLVETTPWFRMHYLGQWVVDQKGNVYLFSRHQNVGPAPEKLDTYQTIMGIDFGWDDAQAFTVGCYSEKDPVFYVLESYKEKGMTLDKAADRIREYQRRYPGIILVGDPARKQLFMELVVRFGLPVQVAEKAEKHAWIELINTDMVLGKVRVVEPRCGQLVDELLKLKKHYKRSDEVGDWEEHPKQPNDCCDCLLYAWRYARHWAYKEPEKQLVPGSPEAIGRLADQMIEQEMEEASRRHARGRKWWR